MRAITTLATSFLTLILVVNIRTMTGLKYMETMKMIGCPAFKALNMLIYEDILWPGTSIHIS